MKAPILIWVLAAAGMVFLSPVFGQQPSEGGSTEAFALRAEIVSERHVRLFVREGNYSLSLNPADYLLRMADGREISCEGVFWTGSREVQVCPAEQLDIRRVHYLDVRGVDEPLLCRFDGWLRHCYSPAELGAFTDSDGATVVRVFSPRADSVRLYLFRERSSHLPDRSVTMHAAKGGIWEIRMAQNFEGWWYDFTVHGPPDPGNEFFEQVPVHVTDPYARVSDDSFGRARIWPRTEPAPPIARGIPPLEDVIAYEVHVEDFTLALPGIPDSLRGSFRAFFTPGLRNAQGEPVGFDYLADLGVNVVHLMPVQEFLHYPDPEWRRAFADDSYMREQMVDSSNYQWGYRTSHAFALESRFRVRGSEPGSQNRDFRDLVATFHERGIAVIVDLVFNHTAERMDAREMYFNLRVFGKHAYYRTNDDLQFIGSYGTETKSEQRPMTARWIYDQCDMLVKEYGVDGFRIDLAGLTDEQTLRELRRRLGPEIIIYGEPWIGSSDPDYEANPDYDWYKEDAPITYFQDDTRNALCGPPDNPEDKRRDRGYAGGNGSRDAAKQAVANTFMYEDTPNEGINYLDIHDNWTLADRFAVEDWNGLRGVEEDRFRIAAAMLLTSLGPVVIHGGTEFMRSKASTPLVSHVKHTETGPIYIHGRRDTYNLRRPNLFLWETLGLNTEDGAACNFQRMMEYWKGLISLRRSEHGAVFRIGEAPEEGYIRWFEPDDVMQLGYVVDDRVLVLVNIADDQRTFNNIQLPAGRWVLVAAGDRAGTTPIDGHRHSVLEGGARQLTLPARDVHIWIRK